MFSSLLLQFLVCIECLVTIRIVSLENPSNIFVSRQQACFLSENVIRCVLGQQKMSAYVRRFFVSKRQQNEDQACILCLMPAWHQMEMISSLAFANFFLHSRLSANGWTLLKGPDKAHFSRKPASKTCVAISVAGTVDPNKPARFSDGKWNST